VVGAHGSGNAVGTHYQKSHRSICPRRAMPIGQGQRLGNHIQENTCVLKEHRRGGPGARFEARGCVGATVCARLFRAVVADGFDGAAGEGFFAEGAFFLGFRLFIQVGMATVLIAFEVRGCGLPAEVTVDALVIDVVGSLDVLGVAVVFVGHGGRWWMNDGGSEKIRELWRCAMDSRMKDGLSAGRGA